MTAPGRLETVTRIWPKSTPSGPPSYLSADSRDPGSGQFGPAYRHSRDSTPPFEREIRSSVGDLALLAGGYCGEGLRP